MGIGGAEGVKEGPVFGDKICGEAHVGKARVFGRVGFVLAAHGFDEAVHDLGAGFGGAFLGHAEADWGTTNNTNLHE
jgi:hypothetical protein